jgi:diaminohydroxyphosphoribosylaminopyrimidine deaminase/5-amino-6-(5-phosphoribosylamino)uracil reductase
VKTRQRPFVVLKAAASLDAKISMRDERTHLSSREADRKTQQLRAAVDGIAVGIGTMLIDDPLLTSRLSQRIRPLVRVVFDRHLRTSARARLFSTLADGPVIIMTSPETAVCWPERVADLERAGAVVRAAADLKSAVASLLEWDVSTLLVEGGAALHASLLDARLVDRVHLIVVPRTLGADAVPLFGGVPLARSALEIVTAEPRGTDIWIEADVHGNH